MTLENALNCTVEYLKGKREGKVVIDREVFEELYVAAARDFVNGSKWQPAPILPEEDNV